MKQVILFALLFAFQIYCLAQAPAIEWQKCLGGYDHDEMNSIQPTPDGGYIIAGTTFSNDGDVSGNHNPLKPDCWVVKIDAIGNLQWQKCYGGTYIDAAYSIVLTTDGGYVFAGETKSDDGDVSGNHTAPDTYSDGWVVKIDQSGNIQWQKCLGGTAADGFRSVFQDADGNFILLGATTSNDSDVAGNHGGQDLWLVKLDNLGTIIWQTCLGGSLLDAPYNIKQTQDGGFILCGYTTSNNGDVSGNHGLKDYWVAKLDNGGSIQWQNCLGGSADDEACSIETCSDGTYLVAGNTFSIDGDVIGNHGQNDIWILKLDGNGNTIWKKCFGGSSYDYSSTILQATDSSYLLAGYVFSNDSDVNGNHGGYDYWITKLDTNGVIIWKQCYGGTQLDKPAAMQVAADGGIIVGGATASYDGDVTGNHGTWDIWLVKLSASQLMGTNDLNSYSEIKLYPSVVNSNLLIESSENLHGRFEIYNSMNQVVYIVDGISPSRSLTLPVYKLSSGIYFLKMDCIPNYTGRFIKE